MKKRLSLALAVVMALSMVLSACGNQNQPNASGSSSTGSAGGDKPSGPVSIALQRCREEAMPHGSFLRVP